MYGLPQAGILANQLLKKRLAKHDYYKIPHTHSLWKHHTWPVQFMLVAMTFHQICQQTRCHYKVEIDWNGRLYCGITLDWNY